MGTGRDPGRPPDKRLAVETALADLGGLANLLRSRDASGVPWRRVADEIERLTRVSVSPKTVSIWTRALGGGDGR